MKNREREMVNAQGRTGTNFIEKSELNAVVNLLNELIAANQGMVDVYETAVNRVENDTNASLLQSYADQHQTFVSELSNTIVRYSGQPEMDSTGSSLLKQAWVSLKAAVTEGDGPILTEVAKDAETILEAYGEAMRDELPEDARKMIRDHMSKARLASQKLSALSAAYNN